MGERIEESFPLDYGLPHKEKRRYAKAKQAFELGIWGHDLNLVKGVELTTKGDYRNNWEDMKQDNRNLRKKLRVEGIISEDCFCAEVSPKSRLLHLHGFYRLTEPMRSVQLHSILSDYWERIHGARVVWVQDIYSYQGLAKYNVKHALKNYFSFEFGNMRLLKSKGWLPLGWKQTQKVLVKWALEHGARWTPEDDFEDYGCASEYVPYAWEIMKNYLWRWCNDEALILDFYDCDVAIHGDKINEFRRN